MAKEFKENSRVWMDYPTIHRDAKVLAENIRKKTPGGIITVAVARGGWIPARIVASSLEEADVPNYSYSVSAAYRELGTPEEYVEVVQRLDADSVDTIKTLVQQGFSIWVIEGICHTGRAAQAVRDYLDTTLAAAGAPTQIYVGALHWSRYETSTDSPWRMRTSIEPDCYGAKISTHNKPHVEYPWEHDSLTEYTKLSKTI